MDHRLRLGGVITALLFTACAHESYVYSPAEQATATVNGFPAARYGVPPERPMGTVLIASPGVVEAKYQDSGVTHVIAVRMVVENNSDDMPWTVDSREQHIVLRSGGESAPAYVNSDGQGSPILQIARGGKRTLDLYYPLPANATDARQIPEFDVRWQVHTGERAVAERTPFDRMRLEPVYANSYYDGFGYEPYWWYDPFWPRPSYVIVPTYPYHHGPPAYVQPYVGGGPRSVPPPPVAHPPPPAR